jgi:plasmid stabilization system protein ParE
MQYRGVEYMVVRTIPRGWRWSVKRENRTEKAGRCYSRTDGIALAKRYIDQLISEHEQSGSDALSGRPPSNIKDP